MTLTMKVVVVNDVVDVDHVNIDVSRKVSVCLDAGFMRETSILFSKRRYSCLTEITEINYHKTK